MANNRALRAGVVPGIHSDDEWDRPRAAGRDQIIDEDALEYTRMQDDIRTFAIEQGVESTIGMEREPACNDAPKEQSCERCRSKGQDGRGFPAEREPTHLPDCPLVGIAARRELIGKQDPSPCLLTNCVDGNVLVGRTERQLRRIERQALATVVGKHETHVRGTHELIQCTAHDEMPADDVVLDEDEDLQFAGSAARRLRMNSTSSMSHSVSMDRCSPVTM